MTDSTLVLITRTRPAARELAERVAELHCEALECAPFQLEGPADPVAVASELDVALPADRVILTSQEAVRQAVALVRAENFSRSLVIVPGQGTAALGRELGLDNVVYPERHGTSEAMLSMPELHDVEGLEVLILAAAGGRGLMGEVLQRRGASVERIHVYSRVPCPLPDDLDIRICQARQVVTLGASWEAVAGLAEGLDQPVRRRVFAAPLIVPSQRIASHAAELGFEHCVLAAGASDDAMISALTRLISARDLR